MLYSAISDSGIPLPIEAPEIDLEDLSVGALPVFAANKNKFAVEFAFVADVEVVFDPC